MQAEYNASRAIAILVTTALLLNAMAPTLAHAAIDLAENNAPSEVIAGVVRYVGEHAREAAIYKGQYVGVTYRKDDGETETAEGFIRVKNDVALTIYRGIWSEKISLDRIDVLIVCDHPSQLQRARHIMGKGNSGKKQLGMGERIGLKLGVGLLTGGLGAVFGGFVAAGGSGNTGLGGYIIVLGGVAIGYTVGVPIGVSIVDPHDEFASTMIGSLLGVATSILIMGNGGEQYWPSLLILPPVGAIFMSELSRYASESRRFSVGLVPNPNGKLSATAMFRF